MYLDQRRFNSSDTLPGRRQAREMGMEIGRGSVGRAQAGWIEENAGAKDLRLPSSFFFPTGPDGGRLNWGIWEGL